LLAANKKTGIVWQFRSFSRSSAEIRLILNDANWGGLQIAALPSFLSAFRGLGLMPAYSRFASKKSSANKL